MRAIALVPAAGVGRRLGGRTRKAFVELEGRPLLFATLDRLSLCETLTDIVVALHAEDLPAWESLDGLKTAASSWKPIHVIAGGATRAHSVGRALEKALDLTETTFIACIHDAARPWVDSYEVDEVNRAAAECGAAALYRPVIDTIKWRKPDGGITTPPRSELHAMQTPQSIRSDILNQAYSKWKENDEPALTDDLQMIEGFDISVKLFEGAASNRKITYPTDLS